VRDGSVSSRSRSFGFTLVELVLSVILFAVLTVATALILRILLVTWSSQERRGGIAINLDRGIEEMARDLRKAREVQSTAGYDEIRYRLGTGSYYIFYLYNTDDSYIPPPAFSQSSYQLRRAPLNGGINGTFTYGAGDIVVNDVVPPSTSDLSFSGSLVTIDLTVTRADETIRSRTQMRPRNV